MKTSLKILAVAVMMFAAKPAMAWKCPTGQHNVEVPAGTAGGRVIEGLTFTCQPDKPPTDPKSSSQTQTQTQNQNQSQIAKSSSKSTSNSNSNSSATGGSVKDSGNSSNVNVNNNTAKGGNATGGQSDATATASNNGNGSNNASYESSTIVNAPKIPVATAYAPEAQATVTCFKGVGAGIQTMAFGGSFGGGKIDKNCAILETARSFAVSGSRLAYCKTMLTNDYAKRAGITLSDCMTVPVSVSIVPEKVTPAVPVDVRVSLQPVPTPEPVILPGLQTTVRLTDLGTCRVAQWNGCLRILDSAVLRLQSNPTAKLTLTGGQETLKAVRYLRGKIDPTRVPVVLESRDTIAFELFSESN